MVRKKVNSIKKDGLAHKIVFKNDPYRVLCKATLGLYCLEFFPFCEVIGNNGRKVKKSASRVEKILSTMVLHKHVYGVDTIFDNMSVPLIKKSLKND